MNIPLAECTWTRLVSVVCMFARVAQYPEQPIAGLHGMVVFEDQNHLRYVWDDSETLIRNEMPSEKMQF